ncbi:MAG: hypothetical protein R3C54_01830 [Parvularculaceae bacterium]
MSARDLARDLTEFLTSFGFGRSRFRLLFLAIVRDLHSDIAGILARKGVVLELLPILKSEAAIPFSGSLIQPENNLFAR